MVRSMAPVDEFREVPKISAGSVLNVPVVPGGSGFGMIVPDPAQYVEFGYETLITVGVST